MSTISASLAAEMNRAPMRLKHRPISFVWRGDEYDYHRLEDGPSLACLDRYTEAEQSWLLHSGRVILPTGAEVRNIIWQVHSISLADGPGQAAPIPQEPPEPKIVERVVEVPVDNPADKARIAELEEKLNSAVSELGRISEALSAKNSEPPPTPLPPNPEFVKLSEYGAVGIPPEIAELMEPGETVAQATKRIAQLLWVEQAELKQAEGKKGENLRRAAEIEYLLGLLARLGDS